MGSVFSQIIGQRHQERMQKMRTEAEAHMTVLKGALEGSVSKEAGQDAYDALAKHIPQHLVDSFKTFGQVTGLDRKAHPPAKPATDGSNAAQFSPGSPASAAASVTSPRPAPAPTSLPAPPGPTDETDTGMAGLSGAAQAPPAAAPPQASALSQSINPTLPSAPDSAQPGNGSPGFSGMGVGPNTPPANTRVPGSLDIIPPAERQRALLPIEEEKQRMLDRLAVERAQALRESQSKFVSSQPAFASLTDRQKMQAQGINVTPELRPVNVPGMILGKSLPADATDAFGNPISPASFYRVRQSATGEREYFPELGTTTTKSMPDPHSSTGWSLIHYDRAGQEIHREPNAPPPAGYVPSTTSTTGTQGHITTIGGETGILNTQSSRTSTRQRFVPGLQPPPSASTGPMPSSAPTPGVSTSPVHPGGSARPLPESNSPDQTGLPAPPTRSGRAPAGFKPLGPSAAQFKREQENPLTPPAQKILMESSPVLDRVTRLKAALEPFKDDDTPATTLLPTLAYRLGYSGDQGAMLSDLNMAGLSGAAQLLKGVGSRSYKLIEAAQVHTPESWTNSKKLMYDKLSMMERNIKDMQAAAKEFGQKYPGLKGPPSSSGSVNMRAPNGQIKPVPPDQVEHFKSLGAVVVQ